jgi:hypothetical protein
MLNVHDEGYSRHASCWTYMMKVIPDMPPAERTWWRLFQTCLMLNVHDEGYSRHASYWMYMMKVPSSCTFSMSHVWNYLHHVRSTWGMSGITFIMYVQQNVIPGMPHAERTWWRLFQTCLMLNVHDEGYSRHASCWTYMMKVIPDMPHVERTWWRLFQTCLMLNVHAEDYSRHASCTFIMYVLHEACLE